jgi:hypothetical protein
MKAPTLARRPSTTPAPTPPALPTPSRRAALGCWWTSSTFAWAGGLGKTMLPSALGPFGPLACDGTDVWVGTVDRGSPPVAGRGDPARAIPPTLTLLRAADFSPLGVHALHDLYPLAAASDGLDFWITVETEEGSAVVRL